MPVDPLATNNRMQVLVMEDARRKSFLSIEPVRQADGCLRLFKEASGSGFSTDEETIGRVNELPTVGSCNRAMRSAG
jgi:hypothetical protein